MIIKPLIRFQLNLTYFQQISSLALKTPEEKEEEDEEEEDVEDPEYQPEMMVLADDEPFEEASFSTAIDALCGSPLKFQIKRKFVSTLSGGTKEKIKQKYRRSKKLLKMQFAAAIAPGQEAEILNFVSSSSDSDTEEINTSQLVKLYQVSDSRSRCNYI